MATLTKSNHPSTVPASLPSPDWIWVSSSNVHVAKDKTWFTSYTPFETHFHDPIFTDISPTNVVGIGRVEIKCKKNKRGGTETLVLKDVLHAPTSLCNIIGTPALSDYSINSGPKEDSNISDKNGRTIGFFDATKPLYVLKLKGPPVGVKTGPSMFGRDHVAYIIHAAWANSERARWEAYKDTDASSQTAREPQRILAWSSYSSDEKQWLKKHYGGEFHFLRTLGLSIYKDEDREQGREIARQFIFEDRNNVRDGGTAESEEDEPMPEEEDEDDEQVFQSDSETDMDGHLADYHFTGEQLQWIGKHYRNSMTFLYSYGLKFYDDEDCREGVAIAEAMMQEDLS